MSGYWNDKAKSDQSFILISSETRDYSAYRTGDIAYVNTTGNLVFCGRRDSQTKIDGHRVELGEIEHFARLLPGTANAAVVLEQNTPGISRLKLFVGGRDIDPVALELHLKRHLPPYMLPASITVLPELPLNLNGKIDRPALARM